MRRANNAQLVKSKEFVGFNLGADYCAEHEWGIKGIKSHFGIETNPGLVGLDKRKITKVPEDYLFIFHNVKLKVSPRDYRKSKTTKVFSVLLFAPGFDKYWNNDLKGYLARPCDGIDLVFESKDGEFIATAWDERGFAIVSEHKEYLEDLYQAILNKDVVIGQFGGGVFQNAGLGIYKISALPENVFKEWKKSDLDAIALNEAAVKTGIREKIENYNEENGIDRFSHRSKGFYSLSPKWISKSEKKTKHPVVFWLNPKNQQHNNYGWYTVEELEQWLQDKGPIPKRKSN